MISRKNLIRILVNTFLGTLLIFLWSRFINLSQILDSLKKANIPFAMLFWVFFLSSNICRAFRMRFLILNKVSFKEMLALNFLNQFLSFTIPIRAGEIARAVYLSGKLQAPFAKTVLWVFIDRFIDFWVTVLSLSVLLLIIPINISSQIRLVLILALVGFSLAAVLIIKAQAFFKSLISIFRIKWLVNFTSHLIEGFDILKRSPKDLLVIILVTVLAMISDSLQLLAILKALGVSLAFLKILLGNMLFALTFLVPAAPGYVGNVEASTLAILSGALGLSPDLASSVGVLLHIMNLIIILIFGVGSLYFLKFNLNLVWAKLKRG